MTKKPFSTGLSRRQFVHGTVAASATGALVLGGVQNPIFAATATANSATFRPQDVSLKGRIWKTLKIGMANEVPGSLVDKFNAIKSAGFAGVEMDAPGMDVKETKHAIEQSGLPVDGTVCSTHWQTRHTSADPKVRATALEHLQGAIRDTHAVGGNTVLLVAGRGDDGSPEEVWQRAVDNIRLALPLAAEKGIYIAIENVWNQFMYDHAGDHTQTADEYVRFIDELNSPWVGMQFDIGNHWKYGSMGDWIRALGPRIVKLDLKGFSRAKNQFTKIGEGDLDWADVRAALQEINYYGWAAAEVGGGGVERLQEISTNMDQVFKLS